MGRKFDPQGVLCKPLVAYLATVSDDGPRNTPVWYLWENGALWMLSHRDNSSARRLIRTPSCAVEIVDFDLARGVMRHLGLRGQASIEPMGRALFRRLLSKYLGSDPKSWNPWFISEVAKIDDPDGRLIRLEPDSTFTNDVSYFQTGPGYAEP